MLRKLRYYRRERGWAGMLKMAMVYITYSSRQAFYALLFRLRLLFGEKAMTRQFTGRKILVIPPTVEWGDLFARAQQMAVSYAEAGWLVVYLTTQQRFDRFCGWKEVRKNVFVANWKLAKRMDRLTGQADFVMTDVFSLRYAHVAEQYHSDRLIYEYVDSLRLIVSPAEAFSVWEQRHRALLQRASLLSSFFPLS